MQLCGAISLRRGQRGLHEPEPLLMNRASWLRSQTEGGVTRNRLPRRHTRFPRRFDSSMTKGSAQEWSERLAGLASTPKPAGRFGGEFSGLG